MLMGCNVKPKQKLSYAIATVLAAHAGRATYAQTALGVAAASGSSNEIAEIIVTAQRREENIQNVPFTIRALTGENITQLNVTTFDDFLKYLPNVTAAS